MSLPDRRRLDPSEAMFAGNRSTVAYSVFGSGRVDRNCLATAFESLRRAYPVLAARIVPSGPEWTIEPAPRPPELRLGADTGLPPAGFEVVGADAVCAVDLGQGDGDFRLTLLTHHGVADAAASLRYLERLCQLYTDTVERGAPASVAAHPLPSSLEQFLAARGFDVAATSPPPRTRVAAAGEPANVPRVRHGRTRLTRSQTDALFARARRHGVTVHGIACGAILLAASEVSRSTEPRAFGVVSSVDLRARAGTPIAAEAGTVIQGFDTAVVLVAPDDDPLRLARAVLDSLSANLANRNVHRAFLRTQEVRRSEVANALMVTNWGRIPTLRFPPGVRVNDFRASARGLRMERAHAAAPSFFVTTCDGRLGVDHPAWVVDDSDPTVAWRAALERAFHRIAEGTSG